MRRAIVTGVAGFLGRHLLCQLERHGIAVTGLTRRPGSPHVAMGNAPWSSSRITRIIEAAEPDVIFHLAGGPAGSRELLEQVNVGLTKAVMQALKIVGIRPLFLCCGSAAEYGAAGFDGVPVKESWKCDPVSAYGAAKLAQTNAVLAFAEETATPVLVARIFNPIGPGMPTHLALGEFAREIASIRGSRGVLHTGHLGVWRDFIDIASVAKALTTLAGNPEARGIVNVCTSRATLLEWLVQLLIKASGKEIEIEISPSRLRAGEAAVIIGSTERLTQFGAAPRPTDFEDVIRRIWLNAEQRWAASP